MQCLRSLKGYISKYLDIIGNINQKCVRFNIRKKGQWGHLFKHLKKSLFQKDTTIRFELDNWYKWYKEPLKFHNAVLLHLENEGYHVETIKVVEKVTSNTISILLIDGVQYELKIENALLLGPTQEVILKAVSV